MPATQAAGLSGNILEVQKIRLPIELLPCRQSGGGYAFVLGSPQHLDVAVSAGPDDSLPCREGESLPDSLTSGLEQEVVKQIFLVWEEPEVDLSP